jgi:tetratricopeptide (TPR) repeat protein
MGAKGGFDEPVCDPTEAKMLTDCLGNPLSNMNPIARQGVDDFVDGFIRYDAKAANVLAAANAEPSAMLAQVYAGMLFMFLESPAAPGAAAPWIAKAEALANAANDRERGALAFLKAWAAGDIPASLDIAQAVLAENPRDLVVLKLAQYHLFNRGDAEGMLATAFKSSPHCRDIPQVGGMVAFGLEQCHRLDEAEEVARAALDREPREPWAQHAIAHVMLTQGRIGEGADFMRTSSETWRGLNSFMSTHNWWHLGLFLISQGARRELLELYDARIWGIDKGYTQDQVGAVSFLARLEFAGIDVGGRWDDVADHLALRAEETTLPFLTLQYLYGLARGGRSEAHDLMAAIKRASEDAPAFERSAWSDVALPTARGILAHLDGDHGRGADFLSRALPKMQAIGGSHAQRDLFEQIYLDALLKAGRKDEAKGVLMARKVFDPDGVPLNAMLAAL